MTIIITDEGDERYIEDAVWVGFEKPNTVRICREGKEDEYVGVTHGLMVSVVP